jgi:hypothetical protein
MVFRKHSHSPLRFFRQKQEVWHFSSIFGHFLSQKNPRRLPNWATALGTRRLVGCCRRILTPVGVVMPPFVTCRLSKHFRYGMAAYQKRDRHFLFSFFKKGQTLFSLFALFRFYQP